MEKIEYFEIGKCYQHASGKQIYLCGTAHTINFGWTFVCEVGGKKPTEILQPCGMDKDATQGWVEISLETFKKANYE